MCRGRISSAKAPIPDLQGKRTGAALATRKEIERADSCDEAPEELRAHRFA